MNTRMFLKLCAVSSSLLLVVAFVSYRAGAFGWLKTSSDRRPDVVDVPDRAFFIQVVPADTISVSDVPWSSKSGAVFVDRGTSAPSVVAPVEEASPDTTVILSGSKSLMVIPPTAPLAIDVVNAESAGQQANSEE